jgi:TIR domain
MQGSAPASEGPAAGVPRDLFLSYNSVDLEAVLKVRETLALQGVSTFYDREGLTPGQPWFEELETALRRVRGVGVFLGRQGPGSVQKREIQFALARQAGEEAGGRTFPVIPVLLEGAEPDVISGFLALNTWVDLRSYAAAGPAIDSLIKVARQEPLVDGKKPLPPFAPFAANCEKRRQNSRPARSSRSKGEELTTAGSAPRINPSGRGLITGYTLRRSVPCCMRPKSATTTLGLRRTNWLCFSSRIGRRSGQGRSMAGSAIQHDKLLSGEADSLMDGGFRVSTCRFAGGFLLFAGIKTSLHAQAAIEYGLRTAGSVPPNPGGQLRVGACELNARFFSCVTSYYPDAVVFVTVASVLLLWFMSRRRLR